MKKNGRGKRKKREQIEGRRPLTSLPNFSNLTPLLETKKFCALGHNYCESTITSSEIEPLRPGNVADDVTSGADTFAD